jgi:HNH endonuclease
MSECIEWTKNRTREGYGRRRVNGRLQMVHRLVWVEANGPIPDGLLVMHTCDNPPCYNLEHLKLGTQSQNMQDSAVKRRHWGSRKTHCDNGHEFTEENTLVQGTRRRCRACANDQARRYRRVDA